MIVLSKQKIYASMVLFFSKKSEQKKAYLTTFNKHLIQVI